MALPKSGKPRIPKGFEAAFDEFLKLPNVGIATAEDLVRLRVRSIKDLARRNPLTLYRRLCTLDGAHHDPCCVDVFMAVVDFAKNGEKRPWWHYTKERKAMLSTSADKALSAKTRRGAKKTKQDRKMEVWANA
jgi:hypothetical protein